MNKAQAASKGGRAVVKKYGRAYMRKIGSNGGRAFWSKYTVVPVGGNDFAIIDRVTHQPTGRTLNGEHFTPQRIEP